MAFTALAAATAAATLALGVSALLTAFPRWETLRAASNLPYSVHASAAYDERAGAPVRLIIDTDMSTDVDDVAALCMAHALADRGEVEIAAVVHNTGLVEGAGAISVINHYYNRDSIPIGAFRSTTFDNPATAPPGSWANQKAAGPYVLPLLSTFPSPIRNATQVPSGVEVYRKVLANSPDHSVTISSIGFMSNLAGLLASEPDSHSPLSGRDLVAAKVKQVAWMGGQYPHSGVTFLAEWNFGGGHSNETGPWSAAAVTYWPASVPLVFSGAEMGSQIFTGSPITGRCCNVGVGCKVDGCAAPPTAGCQPADNPCRAAFDAYHSWDPNCPPRQSWDPATTLFAVRGLGDFWTQHSTGFNRVNDTGANEWVDDGGDHNRSYLVLNPGEITPGWTAARSVAKAIDDLLCAGRR
eukprot:m.158180 g.158180  ORF g.158180 m.158180 type:complete len:411 (-) comp14497_c0_seq2:198-1430(-)